MENKSKKTIKKIFQSLNSSNLDFRKEYNEGRIELWIGNLFLKLKTNTFSRFIKTRLVFHEKPDKLK